MAAWPDLASVRHCQNGVHVGDTLRQSWEEFADLRRHILPLEIGKPIDAGPATDVSPIHVDEVHFLNDVTAPEITYAWIARIEMFRFHLRSRFELGERHPPLGNRSRMSARIRMPWKANAAANTAR